MVSSQRLPKCAGGLKTIHDDYPEQAGPPVQLDEWLLAAADNRFAEPHLDDNRPENVDR